MEMKLTIDLGSIPERFGTWLTSSRGRVIALATVTLAPLALVAAVTKPHTFVAGEKIEAAKVNSNFDTVYTEVNRQATDMDSVTSAVEDLKEQLMPSTCPSDMKLGGVAGTESSFCIEINERGGTSYYNAVLACSALGRHVCTQNQFWVGTTVSGVNGMCNNWEWVGDRDDAHSSGHLQVIIGGNGCVVQSWAWAGQHNNGNGNQPYRCCTGGVSALFD